MLCKNALAERVLLHLPNRMTHASPFQTKLEAANTREE